MVCEDLVSVLSLWPRSAVGHPLDGFGYLAPGRESLRHLGALFSSAIDPRCAPEGHVLVRVLLGVTAARCRASTSRTSSA